MALGIDLTEVAGDEEHREEHRKAGIEWTWLSNAKDMEPQKSRVLIIYS